MSRLPAKTRAMAQPRKPKEMGAQRLAREIVGSIYETGMQPGDKYFSEAEALERHGVSRGTLREALRYLQIEGVIDIRPGPGGGHFVAEPGWENLASTLALLLQFAGAPVSSLIDARAAIEPAMVEMAALNATAEDIEKLDEALALLDRHVGDYRPYYRAYSQFWDYVATATANPFFVFLSPALRRITRTAGIIPNEIERADAAGRARGVRDAIAAHDAALARQRMADLEQKYRTTMHANYPRQMARIISFADFDDNAL